MDWQVRVEGPSGASLELRKTCHERLRPSGPRWSCWRRPVRTDLPPPNANTAARSARRQPPLGTRFPGAPGISRGGDQGRVGHSSEKQTRVEWRLPGLRGSDRRRDGPGSEENHVADHREGCSERHRVMALGTYLGDGGPDAERGRRPPAGLDALRHDAGFPGASARHKGRR